MSSNPVDLPRIERAVREILIAVGEDPDREGLLETPARVARMYAELFSGLQSQPARFRKHETPPTRGSARPARRLSAAD